MAPAKWDPNGGRVNGIWLVAALALVVLVAALAPVIRQRILVLRRDGMLQRLARARGTRVVPLLQYRDTFRFLGLPLWDREEGPDSERALRQIARTPANVPIDLVLHTTRESALGAVQLAHAVIRHPARVTAFVPHNALGSGTLVALAADEIVMDYSAALSPLEPYVDGYSASSLVALRERKPAELLSDEMLIAVERAEREREQARTLVAELLTAGGLMPEVAEGIATTLTTGRWTEDYRLLVEEARSLGLPVTSPLPDELYAYADLFDLRPAPDAVPRKLAIAGA